MAGRLRFSDIKKHLKILFPPDPLKKNQCPKTIFGKKKEREREEKIPQEGF